MWAPDRLDFKIIRELAGSPSQWNVKKSFAIIAKKLRVDEETVRNRLRRMRQEGYLLGWRLLPNPGVIGRKASTLLIEFENSNALESAVASLKKTEGVVVVATTYERRAVVNLFHDFEHEQFAREAQAVASACGGEVITSWQMGFPQVRKNLAAMDWEIIQALMPNPERKLSEVARELRISTRTAKRRVTNLMQSYAIFLLPVVDLRKLGGVPCQLIVEGTEGEKQAVDKLIMTKFDPMLSFRDTGSETHSVFGIVCVNVTEGEEISKWIQAQAGVRSVRMNIVEQPVHVYEWLEKQIMARALASKATAHASH